MVTDLPRSAVSGTWSCGTEFEQASRGRHGDHLRRRACISCSGCWSAATGDLADDDEREATEVVAVLPEATRRGMVGVPGLRASVLEGGRGGWLGWCQRGWLALHGIPLALPPPLPPGVCPGMVGHG